MAVSKFQRTIKPSTDTFNPEARTIEGTFSSVVPYLRTFTHPDTGVEFVGYEILSHAPGDIDTSVLDLGACLCYQHNTHDVRGVIEAYSIVPNERIHGLIRFADTANGEEVMRLVGTGIMRQLSAGYNHISWRIVGEYRGIPVVEVKWKFNELSLVTVAADVAIAGIGRSAEAIDVPHIQEVFTRALAEVIPAKPAEEDKEPEAAHAAVEDEIKPDEAAQKEKTAEGSQDNAQADSTDPELERVTTLKTLGRAMDAEVFAEKCIETGLTPDQFIDGYEDFKREMSAAKKTKTKEKKMDKFDLGRAFQNLHSGKSEGYEGEVAQELGMKLRNAGQTVKEGAMLLPRSVLRSQTMGVATSGGNLLVQQELTNQFVSPLHPAYVMDRLGITRLNLSKSARFSKMEGTQYFLWNAAGASNTRASRENAALVKTNFVTSTDTLTPVRGGTYFEFSDQLGMELDPSFIEMCKQDLSVTIALEEQRVLFKGNGVNEPKGLDERTIQAVAFAGAIPTRDELLAMQSKIAAVNGIPGNWVMSATMLYTLMGVPVGNTGRFLVEDGLTLLGMPIVVTNQIPTGEIWTAQWDTVLWADFGTIQIEIVRDADLALHGMNRYQASLFADTNVKREAWVVKGEAA